MASDPRTTCPYVRGGAEGTQFCSLNGPDPRQWVKDNPAEALELLAEMGGLSTYDAVKAALVDMVYGYLRIQESDKQSAFAARAFKAARELVEIDTSKSWVSEDELSRLAEGHDCARRAIDTGALEQVGFGGCKHYCEGGELDDDGEYWDHEPVLSIETTEGLNHDHPIWPVFRLAATSEEPGDA